jgi:beta-lactamase class A
MDRRAFLWASGSALATASAAAATPIGFMAPRFGKAFLQAVLATERASGGRLGLAVIDTGSGERFQHRRRTLPDVQHLQIRAGGGDPAAGRAK